MKKTLVALAALAATAAFAQSTVTISGTVDAGLESIADSATKVESGRSSTSNFTLAGVEDLGGGLKAKFQISSAFDASGSTNSAVAANAANAQIGNNGMFVGVESATLGSVIVGRPVSTLYGFQQTANGTKGVTGFAATNTVMTGNDSVYTNNAVQYLSPNMAGFSLQIEYSASEAFGVKSNNAVGLKYANGPVTATLVRNNLNDFNNGAASNTAATAGTDYRYTVNQLGASYDFGVAKAFLTYQNVSQPSLATDPNTRAYVLGVSAPVGPGVLWAQYGRASVDTAATEAATIVGLGYKYSLSKRSTVYVNYGNRSDFRLASGAITVAGKSTTGGNGYGIGLAHTF
jgi:predicted porin